MPFFRTHWPHHSPKDAHRNWILVSNGTCETYRCPFSSTLSAFQRIDCIDAVPQFRSPAGWLSLPKCPSQKRRINIFVIYEMNNSVANINNFWSRIKMRHRWMENPNRIELCHRAGLDEAINWVMFNLILYFSHPMKFNFDFVCSIHQVIDFWPRLAGSA